MARFTFNDAVAEAEERFNGKYNLNKLEKYFKENREDYDDVDEFLDDFEISLEL